jgi:chemotaxis protein MotB
MSGKQAPIIIKKKRGGGHGGHHGGAWKVAYADFVTAMMAFFLVMWILGLSDDAKKAISSYFRDPGLFKNEQGKVSPIASPLNEEVPVMSPKLCDPNVPGCLDERPDPIQKAAQDLRQHFKKLAEEHPEIPELKDAITVNVSPEGMRIEMQDSERLAFFNVGGTKPSKIAVQVLEELAGELKKLPNKVEIEGHTDSRPYAGVAGYSNWELSADRANAARRILVEQGVSDRQIARVTGLADRRLRRPDQPSDLSNRRVSFLVRSE